MKKYSSRLAAKKLGIDHSTLVKYIIAGKIPSPEAISVGERVVHAWTDEDIETLRKLLPKIANGRKTRHKKKQSAEARSKAKQPQPRAAVPHKKKK